MFDILLSWLILSVAFYVTAALLPGFELRGGARGAALVAALFGVVNWLIGWLLFVILGVVSLGLGFLLELLFVGSATVFMTGYCPLTRVLSLMPWNRQLPLSRSLIVATFVSRHPRSSVEARQAWAARPGIAG